MNYLFKTLIPKAKQYLDDRKRLKKLLSKATDKSVKLKDKESRDSFKDDLSSSMSLVKDWSTKEYTDIPLKSITSIIAAIIYFVLPTDVIPDFILGTGFLDDAAVFSYLFTVIKDDIDKYKLFKKSKSDRLDLKEMVVNAYESAFKEDDNKFIFFNFLYFFANNDYSRTEMIEFLNRHKNEYENKMEDLTWFILTTDNSKKTKTKELSHYLLHALTAYGLAYCKSEDQIFFEKGIDLIRTSHVNPEIEEAGVLYLNILKKILNGESNSRNIFFNIDFEKHPIKSQKIFDISMGRYIHKQPSDLDLNSNAFDDVLESMLYLIHESDSYDNTISLADELGYSHENYSFSLFLSSLFFKNEIKPIDKEQSKLNKII